MVINKNPNILLGAYYKDPKKHSTDIFVEELKDTIKVWRNCKKITMTKDFNYDIFKH